ncbi:discoidin domain-containing protein [Pontiella agarivorans]|uniref:Discoidin domain-containing protein n=1 Tax=Pontiella agarivorans TaxID=3038953 RepID=A0ABU5MWK2_9BACT|nr:discoidin domain-containing protein [Pontiella agarivorans]MDZ8118598.1 discoidin domain-containing protein [Pontiella agarivorans]
MKNQLKIVTVAALAALVTGSAVAEEMQKLELELPKPLFAGTPKQIRTRNLEKPGTPAPEIMVPKGTVNVAEGKEVTSSDDFPVIGELEYITDADKDGADGSYVELGPGVQWVQIDLGEAKTVYAVALWHYHAQARAYRDIIIQVSDDAEFVEGVTTVFNNDHDNSAGLGVGKAKEYIETNKGKLVDAKGVKGQYVRLYSNGSTGSDMNHYIEVEVFGK